MIRNSEKCDFERLVSQRVSTFLHCLISLKDVSIDYKALVIAWLSVRMTMLRLESGLCRSYRLVSNIVSIPICNTLANPGRLYNPVKHCASGNTPVSTLQAIFVLSVKNVVP